MGIQVIKNGTRFFLNGRFFKFKNYILLAVEIIELHGNPASKRGDKITKKKKY